MKVADVDPAGTVTDAGTVSAELVLVRVTALPPVGAAWFSVTVQALDALGPRLAGLQLIAVTTVGATRLMVTLCEPPRVAVTVADWLAANVPVVALKAADVEPAATVTEAGTVRAALVLVSATEVPPAGAAKLRVTVQVLEAFSPRLVGLQANVESETVAGGTRPTVVVCEPPFRVPVIVTFWLLLIVAAAVAVNVPLVCPDVTINVPGMVRFELLLLSAITVQPDPAGWLRVTVQVLAALGPRLAGLHDTADTSTGTRLMVVLWLLLPRVAVSVADWVLVNVVVVALKAADVAPAVTVTDAGTVSAVLVFARVTELPPDGAA